MIRRTASAVVVVLAGAYIAPAAEKELHVVALYEGHGAPRDHSQPGAASVTVDRPGKEVVLVVSASEAIEWEVTATPKTKLTKVILGGSKRQFAKVPPGAEIEELSRESVKQRLLPISICGYYDIDAPRFRPFVRTLCDHTKLGIASFQGTYRFDPKKPIVVDSVQKDDRLSVDFPQLTPAAQIPKLKFNATRTVFLSDERGDSSGFGEWTQAGPNADGFTQLPKGIRQVTHAAAAKKDYGIDDQELYELNVKLGTRSKITKPEKNFSWPCALTHDAKRDRLVVVCRGGLFEYEPKDEGKWNQLTNKAFPPYVALAWQSKTDTLFAFGVDRDLRNSERPIPTLFELNAQGAEFNKTAIGSPLFSGILGEYGMGGRPELIDLGAELALLVHNENRDSGTGKRGKPEAFLYVIDPKTGKAKLAWKE